MFALFIIFEILSKLYTINGVDYKIHTKIVINTEEKIIYTNHPNKMVKYYTKDNLKIYKDSIILDSIVYKHIKIIKKTQVELDFPGFSKTT